MKRTILPILLASATSILAQTNSPTPVEAVRIDGYAAKVNDRVITSGDVWRDMASRIQDLQSKYQGDELDQALDTAYRASREDLIEQALVLESFKRRGGQIPDQYVEDEIRRNIANQFNGNEAQFEQLLAREKMSRSEYADTIRDQMIVAMMANEEVTQRARVTPEEVRNYYELHKDDEYAIPEMVQYRILVLNKGTNAEERQVKLAEAQRLRDKLLGGADFAELAKTSSEGGRAAEGGLYQWMQPTDAREELQPALKTLPAGQISEIIETESQYYIVKVEARRAAGYRDFAEVRDSINATLLDKERRRLYSRWIDRLKTENYVKIYEDD